MSSPRVPAGELMARRAGSLDPAKFPDEVFELHSIPAFDVGKPEVLSGSQIGSSKQIVQPNDVMISKIVPHIRRASVVCQASGFRQIASGEWIVFRDPRIHPPYLRHYLISDQFNTSFMRTVSGVGGSLLRARPAEVAKIEIPLPPLPEQRRIAAILDKADALRAKRREAIAKLDQLLQAVFIDMFGDPVTNPKGWPQLDLVDLCDPQDRVNYGVVQPGEQSDGGISIVRVGDIEGGELSATAIKKIDPEIEADFVRSRLKGNELLISCVGSIGAVAEVPDWAVGFNIARAITRVPLANADSRPFVREMLRSAGIQRYFAEKTRTVSQPTLNVEFVKTTKVIAPPNNLVEQFCNISKKSSAVIAHLRMAEKGTGDLFASIQHAAFAPSTQ